MWGVNMHSNFYAVYATSNLEEQFHKMTEMGCKIVRTNFTTDFNHMDRVVAFANAYGMKVMTVIGSVRATNEVYDAQTEYELAKMVANRYNGKNGYGKVDFFQIDNEIDLYLANISTEAGINFADGSSKDKHYIASEAQRVCDHFKNSVAGIRAADTDAKIVINSSWTHYGFHDWLRDCGVDYDIFGLDWYTDMSRNYISQEKSAVEYADFVYERYGKPVIICETNEWRGAAVDEDDPASWDDFIEIVKDAYNKPHVIGFCVYELCDNPVGSEEQHGGYYKENHFGIFYSQGSTMLGPKAIYGRLKNIWGGTETRRITTDEILPKSPIINDSGDSGSSEQVIANTDNDKTGSSSYIYYDNDDTDDEALETVEDETEEKEKKPSSTKTTRIPKKTVAKYEWTVMDTVSVLAGSVCVLLIAGCVVFIVIRRKQIKKLLISA